MMQLAAIVATVIAAGRRAILLTVVVLASQWLAGSSACAQGTMGTLPDPISSRDLDGYARRLGLSPQQRTALDPFHEEYKVQFAALREGEIEKFLSSTSAAAGGRGMGGRGMGMGWANTDRKTVEDSLRQLQGINSRIQGLDNSLFDQVQTLLTEDQVAAMTSVRQARERQRYRTGLARMTTFTNPSTQVDLTEMLANLTLSPDERTNVSPLMLSYETSLTSATRKLHDGANSATVDLLDKLTEMGFNTQDQSRQGEMWQAFRQVWGEIMAKMNERALDISELNRRSERSMNSVLAVENARKLRDEFFRRAYPEVRGGSSNTARAFDVALTFDDLTEEQRTAITALRDQYRESADRLNEQIADAVDTQRKTRNFFEDRGRGQREDDDALDKLRDQRRELADATRQQVETTLGPQMTEQLDRRVAEARDQQREERAGAVIAIAAGGPGGVMGTSVQITRAEIADISGDVSRDPFIPAPITGRDADGYAQRLGLAAEQKDIFSGLHAEYTDRFKEIEATDIQAARDAQDDLWSRDDDGDPQPPEPGDVDQVYSLRRKAIESVKQLDDAFFNDVQMAALSDSQRPMLDRVRQSRLRAVYNRGAGNQSLFSVGGRGDRGGRGPGGGGGGGGGDRGRGGPQRMTFMGGPGGGSSEATVDLSILVEDVKPPATDPKQLDATLVEYESSATAAFQNLFETSMRMRQAIDRMSGQFARVERGGEFNVNGGGLREAMQTDGKAMRDASQALVDLNRSTLERLSAQVEAGGADQLRRAYNRKAFPDVFRDSRSAEPRLQAAMALPDLSDQQREQVQGITGEFQSAYDALCDQMIALEKDGAQMNLFGGGGGAGGGGSGGPPQAADIQALQERMRNREKLEFERNDLNDRMLVRLRGTLTEEQVQRLGLEVSPGSF